MIKKTMKQLVEEEMQLKGGLAAQYKHGQMAAGAFAGNVAKSIYKQFEAGMSDADAKMVIDIVISSFSKLNNKSLFPDQPVEKRVNMKHRAYMTFLSYLRSREAEPANKLYNGLMAELKTRDPAMHDGLVKGGFPREI